jgi:hypothetical protein
MASVSTVVPALSPVLAVDFNTGPPYDRWRRPFASTSLTMTSILTRRVCERFGAADAREFQVACTVQRAARVDPDL